MAELELAPPESLDLLVERAADDDCARLFRAVAERCFRRLPPWETMIVQASAGGGVRCFLPMDYVNSELAILDLSVPDVR